MPPLKLPTTERPAKEVAGLLTKWLEPMKPHSKRAYFAQITEFLTSTHLPLDKIGSEQVRNYVDRLIEHDASPSTIATRLSIVRSFFRFALESGAVKNNPASDIEYHREENVPELKSVNVRDLKQLISFAGSSRNKLAMMLMYYAAMTAEELSMLQWSAFSRKRGLYTLTIDGRYARAVPLPPAMTALVDQERLEATKNAAVIRSPNRQSEETTGLTPTNIKRIVTTASEGAQLCGISASQLRNAHAAHAIQAGATLREIQDALGIGAVSASRYFEIYAPSKSRRHTVELLPILI